jgi:hypothetical protein
MSSRCQILWLWKSLRQGSAGIARVGGLSGVLAVVESTKALQFYWVIKSFDQSVSTDVKFWMEFIQILC